MEEKKEVYDVEESPKLQARFCWDNNRILFAPPGGRCFRCNGNIYAVGGYSTEYARSRWITGCPFCHASFCE